MDFQVKRARVNLFAQKLAVVNHKIDIDMSQD